MKKIISMLLVFVMTLGIFAGCGKKEQTSENVKLSIGLPQRSVVTDYEDNAFTEYIEEQANVKLDFVFFSGNVGEYTQQLALMCGAGEELPDVLVGFEFSHYVASEYGEDGYFLDLTDYIDKYAPNYKKQLKKLDDETREYITEKGKNTKTGAYYGMPRVLCRAFDDLQSLMYINQTWLDNLGLQAPTNVDELYSVLQAFATQDPNQNGQADEIPILGKDGIICYLINAFVCYQNGTFNITDGKVWDPIVTDEFRQGVIFANKLVKEGLYSDLSFTMSALSEFRTLISPSDGPSKVGIFVGHHESMTNAATDILNHYTALPALADATGKGGYTIMNQPSMLWSGYITKDCEDPEAAMRLLDVWYTDETITRQRHGEKDVDWVYEEKANSLGTNSYAKVVNSEAFFSGNSTWCYNVLGIMTQENYLPIDQEGEGRIGQASRLCREQWEVIEKANMPKEKAENLVYTKEEYETREDIASEVNNYLAEQMILFISGEKDPSNDAAWSEFLSTLESLGRSKLMKICQTAYDRK